MIAMALLSAAMAECLPGVNGTVRALTVWDDGNGPALYVGGGFGQVGGVLLASRIARWDGLRWEALGSGITDFSGGVHVIAEFNGELIVGGSFTSAGGVPANRIASWNGSKWQALGDGVSGLGGPFVGPTTVYALAVYNGELLVGGDFNMAGEVSTVGIARWNGSEWLALNATPAVVTALTLYNGELVAGGTLLGGQFVSTWNGRFWQSVGGGVSGGSFVWSITVHDGDLIAGGDFTMAGGTPVQSVGRWNGSAWSSLGKGLAPFVFTLDSYSGELIAGGSLGQPSSGALGTRIVRWDGRAWQPLDGNSDMNNEVRCLAEFNGELFVGGQFTTVGNLVVNRVASWDSRVWHSLGPTTGDFDCDGHVGDADLAQLLAQWGTCPAKANCPADIAPPSGGDGAVNAADLAELLANWG